ncbi:AtpZ/AtpI family protein [Burkholderiaceae bacterium FT117]|uniref:AtpZ/AtpI family protein n=1 Tax=Zeimonas sediminis TaxID=2944268 RepID=UPI002342EF23|nr:AtpZ/AtpI family protein [Zeimonas sediminis]MCM5569438.1 AtpZ/AtpI family protein [Zeimonas sediminis]
MSGKPDTSDERPDGAAEGPARADSDRQLERELDARVRRMQRAERERGDLLAQSVFLGTIAGLFVVPIVAGAYLGRWIDEQIAGYSVRWTVGLICTGVAVGAINVYFFVKDRL